ncbi:MAG: ATP-binding protein [Asticcacaulis sp.]
MGTSNLGLGLFIADEIVKGHDGTIAVTSNEADGTVFTVHLPRKGAATVVTA